MPVESILDEVEQLHAISTRLEDLAEHHTGATVALLTIAGSFATQQPSWRLVAIKLKGGLGH